MALVLDCTLRDGGYVNEWNFSRKQFRDTILGLLEAKIDIIECGFLDATYKKTSDFSTRFDDIALLNQELQFLGNQAHQSQFVAMIDCGSYLAKNLIDRKSDSCLDGIRLAFRKNNIKVALSEMENIIHKGYKLFVQPMSTNLYSKQEIKQLLFEVRQLQPYAVYIVDTLGNMQEEDLFNLFSDFNELDEKIFIGFHSHNNLQLSYANAMEFTKIAKERGVIVDTSIYGMGRGAGNLNTELFCGFLNHSQECLTQYAITPLLSLIDRYYYAMSKTYSWGYSIFHYLSASIGVHPNYASFLINKKHLKIESIQEILESIPSSKAYEFDRAFIEKIYFEYNLKNQDLQNFTFKIQSDKKILLLGSGKHLQEREEDILRYRDEYVMIALNYVPKSIPVDFVFFNSPKRFDFFKEMIDEEKILISSNIVTQNPNQYKVLDYLSLITFGDFKNDSSVIMMLNACLNSGMTQVTLAGIDGFSPNDDNYCYNELDCVVDKNVVLEVNEGILRGLIELSKSIDIEFLTPSIFQSQLKGKM